MLAAQSRGNFRGQAAQGAARARERLLSLEEEARETKQRAVPEPEPAPPLDWKGVEAGAQVRLRQGSVGELLENLKANAELAGRVLHAAIAALPPRGEGCGCGSALEHAVLTAWDHVPAARVEALSPIVGRLLPDGV